jgi:hypothetical protein
MVPVSPSVLPRPTFLTRVDPGTISRLAHEYTEVDLHPDSSADNPNNYLPVEFLKDGSLGIPLICLSSIIQKLRRQLYAAVPKAEKGTQTMTELKMFDMLRNHRAKQASEGPISETSRKKTGFSVNKSTYRNRRMMDMKLMLEGSPMNRTFDHTTLRGLKMASSTNRTFTTN